MPYCHMLSFLRGTKTYLVIKSIVIRQSEGRSWFQLRHCLRCCHHVSAVVVVAVIVAIVVIVVVCIKSGLNLTSAQMDLAKIEWLTLEINNTKCNFMQILRLLAFTKIDLHTMQWSHEVVLWGCCLSLPLLFLSLSPKMPYCRVKSYQGA